MVLQRLMSEIALPCRFQQRGCPNIIFGQELKQHEIECRYRPVGCPNFELGCQAEYSVKDMVWHTKMCKFGKKN